MSEYGFSDSLASLDPAICFHSVPDDIEQINTHSEDLSAFAQHWEEETSRKSKKGIVIQHRSWRLAEAFRSEEDKNFSSPTTRSRSVKHSNQSERQLQKSQRSETVPSSPPLITMPFISSPVVYAPTQSPPPVDHSKKRRREGDAVRSPLKKIAANRVGGFLVDESDDDDIPDSISKGRANTESQLSRDNSQYGDLQEAQAPATPPDTQDESDRDHLDTSAEAASVSGSELDNDPGQQGLFIRTCQGKSLYAGRRKADTAISYERLIAARSESQDGHARKSYYGIDIHSLMDENASIAPLPTERRTSTSAAQPSVEDSQEAGSRKSKTLLWTEKYRARKFTDLVGDERTHRSVLRWLKAWDPIVFPGMARAKRKASREGQGAFEEHQHRKILMMTGPPGLGKTTLAHVCARQAGYEIQEINASDERSRNVVNGRIRDMVGTENVRGVDTKGEDGAKQRKAAKPVCVIVDEVDGVVGGSGSGGEGGFVKALIDLVQLDQRNSLPRSSTGDTAAKKKKKGDSFRILRPLVLICNDVYHPALRPLRQSGLAEIIHCRKPPLNMVISRIQSIFEKEGIPSDTDAIRRLCEATWDVSSRKGAVATNGTADGDIRSVMVMSEWVATKLRSLSLNAAGTCERLTRPWLEQYVLGDASPGGGADRTLGPRDVVDRVFQIGAGFPALSATALQSQMVNGDAQGVIGVAEAEKRRAIEKLRGMVAASGDSDRIVTDCFTTYPTQPIQDDTFLTKPCAAYDWLHFHDQVNHQILSGQEWELAPYLSSPVLAFHHLFATSSSARAAFTSENANKNFKGQDNKGDDESAQQHPFLGPAAPYAAVEMTKASTSSLQSLQSGLSLPLARMYRSTIDISTELLPYTLRMLAPDVKPVIVNTGSSAPSANGKSGSFATASVRKASEKALVTRSVNCMAATGVRFERTRVENLDTRGSAMVPRNSGGFVYRMEPPLDSLASFETFEAKIAPKVKDILSKEAAAPAMSAPSNAVRYAVRQVLEQEWKREAVRIEEEARIRRMHGLLPGEELEPEHIDSQKQPGLTNEKSSVGIDKLDEITLNKKPPKRDFFGRIISRQESSAGPSDSVDRKALDGGEDEGRVWVSYREGFSNAVKKPISLEEFMRGL